MAKTIRLGLISGLCLIFIVSGCNTIESAFSSLGVKSSKEERVYAFHSLSENLGEPHQGKTAEKIHAAIMPMVLTLKNTPQYKVSTVRSREVIRVSIAAEHLFDPNQSQLATEGKTLLQPLIGQLKTPTIHPVLIAAYMDDTGSDTYLKKLTEKRAKAVELYLESQGISSENIVSYGKGNKDPRKPNDSEKNRAENRRVDFYILPQ